jgi:hypothetical protein
MKTLNDKIALALNTEVVFGKGQHVVHGRERCKAYSFRLSHKSTNHCGQDRVGFGNVDFHREFFGPLGEVPCEFDYTRQQN